MAFRSFSANIKKRGTFGFTLIELLVVVAIFGILAAVIFASYSETKRISRNAKRLEDIRSIQNSLDLYHATYIRYPGTVGTNGVIQATLSELVSNAYITALPNDPSGFSDSYYYCPGDGTTAPQSYTLRARMEAERSGNPAALSGDLDGVVNGCDCSDAADKLYYCVAP